VKRVDLLDLKVADGYVLRFLIVRQLNEYVSDLNDLYMSFKKYDFDTGDLYIFYEYQKLLYMKVQTVRRLLRFLNGVCLISDKNLDRMMCELDEMTSDVKVI